MLENLFRLDGTPEIIGPNDPMPPMSRDDVVRNVVFKNGGWAVSPGSIQKVSFRNVAFSKAAISRITFTDCNFEDCLFLGTEFSEIEFHGCHFLNCNFWKARFRQVYLDPNCIALGARFKVEAANAGISTFQALLANFADERQDEYFMRADIRFRRWKRYQIWFDLRRDRIRWHTATWRWLSSTAYEGLAGFGYRPGRFFLATIVLFLAVACLNHWLIGGAVEVNGQRVPHTSFLDTVFYTFSILTVLGFSSIVPVSGVAKLLSVFEALAAIGWLGILTSVLVKRFLR